MLSVLLRRKACVLAEGPREMGLVKEAAVGRNPSDRFGRLLDNNGIDWTFTIEVEADT
jgi:hypothetical protein